MIILFINKGFWGFRNAAQRDWFILRWIDSIPQQEKEIE